MNSDGSKMLNIRFILTGACLRQVGDSLKHRRAAQTVGNGRGSSPRFRDYTFLI